MKYNVNLEWDSWEKYLSKAMVKYCTNKIAKGVDYGMSHIKEMLEEVLQMQD